MPTGTFLDSPLVTITCGAPPSLKSFETHSGLLMERSECFYTRLKDMFTKKEPLKLKLLGSNPEEIAQYLEIAISNEIVETSRMWDHTNLYLAKVYVLAEKFKDPKTQNICVRGLYKNLDKARKLSIPANEAVPLGKTLSDGVFGIRHPNAEAARIIFEGTSSRQDAARKLIVDYCSASVPSTVLFMPFNAWPKDFLMQLCSKLMDNRSSSLKVEDEQEYMAEEVVQLRQ